MEEIQRRIGNEFFYLILKSNFDTAILDIRKEAEGNILKLKYIEKIESLNIDDVIKQDALQYGLALLKGAKKLS